MRVTVNPQIIVRLDGESRILIEDSEENTRLVLDSLVPLTVASLAEGGIEFDQLVADVSDDYEVETAVAERLISRLLESNVLLRDDDPDETRTMGPSFWSSNEWDAAWSYHRYIRDFPFAAWDESGDWKADLDTDDLPPVYKRYDDTETLPLPPVDVDEGTVTLETALSRLPIGASSPTRQSEFGCENLSKLLYYGFGEVGCYDIDRAGKVLLKPSPSGGGRHPTEAYVVVNDVHDIESGIYHYSVEKHGLDVIERTTETNSVLRETGIETGNPSVVVVLTSKVLRNMVKYDNSRAFRIVQHDIGHVLETVKLVALGQERDVTFDTTFDAEAVESRLGIDGIEEPLFGYISVF